MRRRRERGGKEREWREQRGEITEKHLTGAKKKRRENVEETRQTVRGRDKREIIRGDVYQTCGEGSGKKSRDHVKADGGRTRQKRTHEGKQDR